jgi:asparagine synthase (glutamine-hydrolysing)
MSGIAVIWNRDGRPVDRAQLVQMTQLMKHRGPDGERHWFQGPVAIGHRALNTTPESGSDRLPLPDEASGLCLTFDGRIDNREELKSLLDMAGADAITDAELILGAYRKWGEDCPEHLLGDFAFAIWDERRKRLFCARDFLGVRPLFHAILGDTFVCASEVQALFALPGLKRELNLPVVSARLLRKCIEFDDTLYLGISRLPVAHCLTVTRESIRLRRYWDIDPARETRYRSDDQYAEHFRELFFQSVRGRMRSSEPIAAMLSGGLDSSSIVSVAQVIRKEQKIDQPDFQTFSMVFDRLSLCDERPFINEVVRKSGAKANFHVGDRNLDEAAIARRGIYPGLLYSPQGMFLGEMFKGIKARKFPVLLDGTGGDELAGNGFYHLSELMLGGKWLSLSALVREYAANYKMSAWRLFFGHVLRPSIPVSVKRVYRLFIPRDEMSNSFARLVREDALERTGARERIEHPAKIPDFLEPMLADMYEAIFTGWGPVLTEWYELLVSFAGIELRQPFRDKRLLEFALSLPPSQLWRDGRSRIAFRNAMKDLLPEKVLLRRGKGAFLQLYGAVLAGSQAREVRSLLEDSVLARLGLVDADALRDLVERYQNTLDITLSAPVSDLLSVELACRDIIGEPIPRLDAAGGESR